MNRREFLKSLGLAALAIAGGVGFQFKKPATGKYRLITSLNFAGFSQLINSYNRFYIFNSRPKTLFMRGLSWEKRYCGLIADGNYGVPYYVIDFDIVEQPYRVIRHLGEELALYPTANWKLLESAERVVEPVTGWRTGPGDVRADVESARRNIFCVRATWRST